MKEYDSVLKEKKVYEEENEVKKQKPKYKIYIFLYFVIMLIVLIVYYIIYYQNILSPNNILINDMNTIIQKYQSIFEYIDLNLDDSQKLEGILLLNDLEYNCGLLKNEDAIQMEISNVDNYLTYYTTKTEHYISLSSLPDKKIKLDTLLNLNNLKKMFSKLNTILPNEKYIKRIYLEENTPVVEVSTTITNNEINQFLGNNQIRDNYEILVTFKNHAITNGIVYTKMIINNRTTNQRNVFTYKDGILEYTDNEGNVYKITLSIKKEDFHLKIYKEEELYSIFLGKRIENTYQYTYQIIDKIYNITLDITQENNGYQYQLTSIIERAGEKQKNIAKISLYKKENMLNEKDNFSVIEYKNLTKEEQKNYQEFLHNFILPFRKFI